MRSQYGLSLASQEFRQMRWDEFAALLSGIGPETALGRVVAIRSETDPDILKHYTPEQRRIRDSWMARNRENVSKEQMADALENIKRALIQMAGGGG
nr:MAG TPA: hypothetical protein [Caudoviricetes sp.]